MPRRRSPPNGNRFDRHMSKLTLRLTGGILLAAGILVPSAVWIPLLRGNTPPLTNELIQGGFLFRIALFLLGSFIAALSLLPPQPPRLPRLEQNTRWPRAHCAPAWAGSLPRRKLCRFSVSTRSQRGQRCCLREKAIPSAPTRRAQNEKASGTSGPAARSHMSSSSFSWTARPKAGLG